MSQKKEVSHQAIANLNTKIPLLADTLNKVLSQHPEMPAIEQGDEVKSYYQVMTAAQNIAAQLLSAGIMPGQRIALDLPRSIALYETILGCLFAGISFMSLPRGFAASELMAEIQRANCAGI